MSYLFDFIIKSPLVFIAIYAILAFLLLFIVFRIVDKHVKRFSKKKSSHSLARHFDNPIIRPALHKEWESVGTFNPAAVKDNEGFVNLFYRAMGADGLSRIGHAKSRDGLSFDKRSSYPVFVSTPSIDPKDKGGFSSPKNLDTTIYTSGGGWGGCEDPRTVVIGGRVYMTYTAFEGWSSVRIGLTSIAMEDMKKNRWNWKKPKFLSAVGKVNKNWVLFPEKINGKIAVLHGVTPDIKIDYIDEGALDSFSQLNLKSVPPTGGRPEHWDNWVRGAGPPPIKTELGWLLLYHAMDKNDPDKYKLGAMILDAKEPTHILYRSHEPILEPDMPYENDWKPGVVYASGALILNEITTSDGKQDGELVVYYGGGDKYVCVAKTPLRPLLNWLVEYGKVQA